MYVPKVKGRKSGLVEFKNLHGTLGALAILGWTIVKFWHKTGKRQIVAVEAIEGETLVKGIMDCHVLVDYDESHKEEKIILWNADGTGFTTNPDEPFGINADGEVVRM